ncbi:MAG: hypothetical protein QW480_02065 [Candidatus Aenigmatarchaeota archaeon]
MRIIKKLKGELKDRKEGREINKKYGREDATDLKRFFASYNLESLEEKESAYMDFSQLLLLNIELIKNTSKEIAKRAEDYARNNIYLDLIEAEYRFAAGIALIEGNPEALTNYLTRFNEIREKRGKERMFEWTLRNPEKAVEIAKAFYEWRENLKIRDEKY